MAWAAPEPGRQRWADHGQGGPLHATCIENAPSNQIQITNNRPDGPRTYLIPGQIPQDARRVVFHDAEYDGPKRGGYDPHALTWHWDNIQVHAAAAVMPTPPRIDLTAPVSVPPEESAVPGVRRERGSQVGRQSGSRSRAQPYRRHRGRQRRGLGPHCRRSRTDGPLVADPNASPSRVIAGLGLSRAVPRE